MEKKKGQAAMEFLMTYGWAILAAIIVIGVLALYFRPGTLVGQTTTMKPPLTAVSWAISAAAGTGGAADIEVRNGGAETMTITASTDITMTVNSPSGTTCTPVLSSAQGGAAVTYPYSWSPGVTLFLRCDPAAALAEDSTFDADISVGYTSGSGSIQQFSTGTIAGRVNA